MRYQPLISFVCLSLLHHGVNARVAAHAVDDEAEVRLGPPRDGVCLHLGLLHPPEGVVDVRMGVPDCTCMCVWRRGGSK